MYRVVNLRQASHLPNATLRHFHTSKLLTKSSPGNPNYAAQKIRRSKKLTRARLSNKSKSHDSNLSNKPNDFTASSSRRFTSSLRSQNRRKSSSALSGTMMTGSRRVFQDNKSASLFSRFNSREAMEKMTQLLSSFLLKPRTLPIPRWITPQHFSLTFSECFGHASFLMIAAAYYSEDFLVLRIIAVAGSTSMLVFTYFHPHGRVLWLPFRWNLLFIAINSYRIGKVFYQKFLAAGLSDNLKQIYEDHFYVLDIVDYGRLVRGATEEVYEEGDLIVGQGQMNRYVRMVVEGEVDAVRDGTRTYILEEGNFVSEAGLHAGLLLEGQVESCCSLVASSTGKSKKVRLLRWDRTELADLVLHDSNIRRSLKAALSWDIVRKLKGQRHMWFEGKVSDPELWTKRRSEQNDDRYAAILQNMLHHPEYLAKLKPGLDKYRIIHHIDDEHHRLALKRCGWTPEEYEIGVKASASEDEEEEYYEAKNDPLHDWKWRISKLVNRMFD